jgi:hypothetical protein
MEEMGMKHPIAVAALLGAFGAPPSTADDGIEPAANMPNSYRTECGSCHLPYPPHLLSAEGAFSGAGWRTIMAGLRNHFGENAEVEESVHRRIEQYLVDHAASSNRRFGSRSNPPRLTTTLWFRRNHGSMKSYYTNPRVASPAECSACHPRAQHWHYAKEDVVLPQQPRMQEHATMSVLK